MSLTKVSYAMINGEVANVLDYGAKGDGTTDDTAAYLAAIDTGRNVYFPEGTYVVAPVTGGSDRTSAAVLSDGQCLFGDGANSVIKWKTGVTAQTLAMITDASNILISGLKFVDAALALQITPDSDGSVANVTISNCYFENLGIALGLGDQLATNNNSKYCENITVQNCDFNTVGVHGVLLSNVNGFIVDNCYFTNIGYFVGSGGDCIDMSQGSRYGTVSNCIATDSRYFCKVESSTPSGGVAATCLSHDISILNNNIYAMTPQGSADTEFAIAVLNGVSDIIISNNTINYPNTAIFCSDTNPAATGALFISQNSINDSEDGILLYMDNAGINIPVIINNNNIVANNRGMQIIHISVSIKDNFITADIPVKFVNSDPQGVSIVGNHMLGGSFGIFFSGVDAINVEISSNKISSSTNYLYLDTGGKQVSIASNHFRAGTGGAYINAVDSLTIASNYIQDVNGTNNFPSLSVANVSNAFITSNTFNTNSSNPNVSLQVAGTLTNVLVLDNISSRGVTVASGTNVVNTNNAFVIGYTA